MADGCIQFSVLRARRSPWIHREDPVLRDTAQVRRASRRVSTHGVRGARARGDTRDALLVIFLTRAHWFPVSTMSSARHQRVGKVTRDIPVLNRSWAVYDP
jgi:hypothetical protein